MVESMNGLDEAPDDNAGSPAGPRNISPAQVVVAVVAGLGLIVVLEFLRRAVLKGARSSLTIQRWLQYHP